VAEFRTSCLIELIVSDKLPALIVNEDTRSEGAGDRFPATRWSAIVAARSADPGERARALETLLAAYWKPVFKYIRLRWNRGFEDAQDLTQGFFAGLLERELLAKYDPGKSRLRTFLRLCVDSFVMNEEKAARRQKRGGSALHVALDFQAAESELGAGAVDPAMIASPESPEAFFEKEWVRSLFGLAVEDLRKLCQEQGKEKAYRLFEKYDLEEESVNSSYAELAQEFGMAVTDVTNALAWARREFRRMALERLRQMCGDEEEFRREARAVFGWEVR
jgi:RNA polymerase sigma factor (sigma-70 family)